MKTIDRKTAALLWANEYKLVDREGLEYLIEGVYTHFLCLWSSDHIEHADIKFEQIGTDYFVLCRNYDQLTKEIEPGVVPVDLLIEKYNSTTGSEIVDLDYHENESSPNEQFTIYGVDSDDYEVAMPHFIYDAFFDFHFKPSSLPDEACKFIELNQPPKTI